uniref:NADH dehydrogenase subunit 6 n=1 Tax=Oligolophus tienmushanensis TaxID=1508515 RepID=A0A140X733_9ARAC|nr:NADH dehydrogenase subunit 6 [Oligolophus tienmushanensis]AIG60118.1 NADH dehydrogenase subunit 6 [Oligolophus tienmushanensis]
MSLMIINTLLMLSAYTIHPLVIIMSLIICTSVMSINVFYLTKISLFSYMIMLVILGGLIILFIYMASLAPNEPIHSKKMNLIIMMSMATSIIMMAFSYKLPYHNNKALEISMLMNNISLITIAASYLFITLVVVVNITKISKGPLRSNF